MPPVILCPKCRTPQGQIEVQSEILTWFYCPLCKHRWVAEERDRPRQPDPPLGDEIPT
jgi:hypothetical protein